MPMTGCRHFSGYRPCGKNLDCSAECPSLDVPSLRILIVGLEALGAVVRATSLLPALKRKFPKSHITWVTQAPADQLLLGNIFLDRILTTAQNDMLQISALEFDIAFTMDKSLRAAGVLKQTTVDMVYGFIVDPRTGAIFPATEAATELWEIGLSDHKKFYENAKTEAQLLCESFELEFRRDEYQLSLSESERTQATLRKRIWAPYGETVIGINTGCSGVLPYKKLSIEAHRILIKELQEIAGLRVVLLGGKEDAERNAQIGQGFDVVQSDTHGGLRDGIVSVEACDVVVTGDSLGMHLGIALKKWVVAWFGPTCAHEIDLYERGIKIQAKVDCGPCWKRSCHKSMMCYDRVDTGELIAAVLLGVKQNAKILRDSSNSIPG